MNIQSRLARLENISRQESCYCIARQVGEDEFLVTNDCGGNERTMTRSDIGEACTVPVVIVPKKCETVEEWAALCANDGFSSQPKARPCRLQE